MAKAQEQQRGFIGDAREAIVNFYRETVGELRKVVWPTWLEARNLTAIVLVVIVVMSAILGSFDWMFAQLMRLLVSLPI
jgi:preprotein translocase subunit SecE